MNNDANLSKRLVLFQIFFVLYEMSGNLSNDIYLPAILDLAKDFQITPGLASTTIAAWLAGDACLQWLIGPLADGYGKRKILLLGGILFLLSTFFCIISTNFSLLVIARIGQGIGVCSIMIAGYATIYETFEDEQLVKLLALLTSIAVLAPMGGPLLGGYLLDFVSWKSLFGIIFILATASLIGLYWTMPKSKTPTKGLHMREAFLGYKRLLNHRGFLLHTMSLSLLYATLMVWITASPIILMEQLGVTEKQFGLCQIPIFGAYILAAQLRGKFNHRIPLKKGILISMGFSVISAAVLVILSSIFAPSMINTLIPMSAIALGIGFVMPVLNKGAFDSSQEPKGVTSAMFYMIMMLTGMVFSLLVGFLMEAGAMSFTWLVLVSILAAMICFKNVFLRHT